MAHAAAIMALEAIPGRMMNIGMARNSIAICEIARRHRIEVSRVAAAEPNSFWRTFAEHMERSIAGMQIMFRVMARTSAIKICKGFWVLWDGDVPQSPSI